MRNQAALALAGLAVVACQAVPRALSPSANEARTASDELLRALADRFGPAEGEPRFALLRPKLARAGLVPSRVFDDPAAWTRAEGPVRELVFWGEPGAAVPYRVGVADRPRAVERPGEYRGRLQLERLRPGEFRWRMEETLGLGSLTIAALERSADALLRLAERAPGGDARGAVREALPRTSAALGRLFSLDRLELLPVATGGRTVAAEAALHPEWLAERMPGYATFLRRHVASMRMSLRVEDAGALFWEASLRDGRLALRLRIHEAALAPLEGAPRRLSGRCLARCAITMKEGLLQVGFEELKGDVSLQRGPSEVGFLASFRGEPDWRLPFFVEPLLRGPLRRPFEDDGAMLAYVLRDASPGSSSSSVTRDYRLTVRESWIVRWLGGNVGGAVLDFRRGAEAEADRFTRDAFLALRDDVLSLLDSTNPPS